MKIEQEREQDRVAQAARKAEREAAEAERFRVRRYPPPEVVAQIIAFFDEGRTEIPGHPAADYARTVLGRFENTGVRDQIARLCIDGTAKFPTFLVPTVERQLELDGPVECAALALAGWARYLATVPAAERAFDPHGDRAATFAAKSIADPPAFLEFDQVFTPRLRESERFRDAFVAASNALAEHGSLGALQRL